MKKITCLYEDMKSFLKKIDDYRLDRNKECLLRIFTSNLEKDEAIALANNIKKEIPGARIIGCSANGFIFDGDIIDDRTMIIIQSFEKLKLKIKCYSWDDKTTSELVSEIHNDFISSRDTIHVLFSHNYPQIDKFTNEINKLTPIPRLIGGIVCPLNDNPEGGFIFTEDGDCYKGVIVFQMIGKIVNSNISYNIPNDPISDVFEITKINNGIIEEIEGEPSKLWFEKYFNVKENSSANTIINDKYNETYLIYFIMLLEGHNGAGRFLKYDFQNENLGLYYSDLPNNTKFRVGFFNPMKSREMLYQMYINMIDRDIESLFAYVCLFRKIYFTQMIETELSPLKNAGIYGLFMHGEICYINGKNEMLNGSFLLSETAERESKCKIDLEVFNKSAKIKIDSSVVDFVMKEKRDELRKQASFIGQNEKENIDADTRLSNIIQFKIDNEYGAFKNLMMIYIENADMVIGCESYSKYIETVVDGINQIQLNISQILNKNTDIYELNYCTFSAVLSDNMSNIVAQSIGKILFDKFRILQSYNTNIPLVIKFVIVIGGDDILQRGLVGLQKTKLLDIPYLIVDDKEDKNNNLKNESNVISLIKQAITERSVIPYYQGIYNNKEKIIDKYEALMRIVDKDGNIYPPHFFMNVAKKYHLYLKLSKLMIERVLLDFSDRTEKISINISAYEIYSEDYCEWFFRHIERFQDPSRIIIEVVESEELKDEIRVKEFISRAKEYGVALSVDDFGDGYSNLMQILRIEPKYIKVDGSIVKELYKHRDNRIVIQTIHFLAKNIDAEVVAEFVEDKNIQRVLEEEEIEYSQGYYFSKPRPIDELGN